jgi:proline dehydrogenase
VLRAILLFLSKSKWLRNLITGWGFARRAASRFVAGDSLSEALQVIGTLNNLGMYATVDHLGEDVTNRERAVRAKQDYLGLLEGLAERNLEANASVKLTQLGLNVDYALCLENLREIIVRAAELGIMVRIDIEDSTTVDRTWQIFRDLRAEGYSNVGLVVQAYLYRSEQDVEALLEIGTHLRLCKGAYNEPAHIAFPKKSEVDANYDRLTHTLIEYAQSANNGPPLSSGKQPAIAAIATHDETRIEYAKQTADELGLPQKALEFQMLYGIRPDLQRGLLQDGFPVRIYVPYGTEWYLYYMRRLAERPANVWFLISNLLHK